MKKLLSGFFGATVVIVLFLSAIAWASVIIPLLIVTGVFLVATSALVEFIHDLCWRNRKNKKPDV